MANPHKYRSMRHHDHEWYQSLWFKLLVAALVCGAVIIGVFFGTGIINDAVNHHAPTPPQEPEEQLHYLYVFGGLTANGYTDVIERYSIKNNTWEQFGTMPDNEVGSFISIPPKVYRSGGGYDSTAMHAYTPGLTSANSSVWETLSSMPRARQEHGSVLYNNLICLIGGSLSGTPILVIDCYNITSNSWSQPIADITIGKRHATAVSSLCQTPTGNHTIIYVFGAGSGYITIAPERYNPANNTWTTLTNINVNGWLSSIIVVPNSLSTNTIYSIGGMNNAGYPDTSNYRFNCMLQNLTDGAPLPIGTKYSAVTLFQDSIYIMNGDDSVHGIYSPAVQRYNVSTDTWDIMASMNIARKYSKTTAL